VHTRLLLCSLTMRQGIFHWLEVMDTCFKAPNSNYPAYSCIIRLRSHGGMRRGPDISWQRPSSSGSILFAFCHVSRAIATKWKRLGADKPGYTNWTSANLVFVKILVHWLHYCSFCGFPKWTYRAISGVVGGPHQSSSCRYSGFLKRNIAAGI
jgi:hypothetical protein